MTEYELPSIETARALKASLRDGPSSSLARLVASENLDRFLFQTFARANLSRSELLNFSEGGKAEGADDWLMDLLVESPLTANAVFLVEDWRATPESPFLKEMNLPTVICEGEVYYVVREHDPRRIPHWRRIFSNTVPTFHAFLADDDPRLVPGATVPLDLLKSFARHLRMIIWGAYDGESYILLSSKTLAGSALTGRSGSGTRR